MNGHRLEAKNLKAKSTLAKRGSDMGTLKNIDHLEQHYKNHAMQVPQTRLRSALIRKRNTNKSPVESSEAQPSLQSFLVT